MKIHSFLPWIVLKSLFMCLAMFAAGDAGFAALGGGESSVAVMDGGEDSGGDDSAGDAGGEGAGAVDGEGAEAEEGKEPGAKPEGKAGPQLAKPLSPDANKAIKALKDTSPKAFKEINQRLWTLNAMDNKIAEHFPEGLESAISLKGDVDGFLNEAGANDLGEVKAELNDYRVTDGKIKAGDISFVKDLPEEIQNGIYQMVPHFVDQWATRDNEGYQRYFAGLVVNTMRDTEFTTNLRDAMREVERMGMDNEDVANIHKLLKANFDWIEKLKQKATAAPEKKSGAAAENDDVAKEKASIQNEKRQLAVQRVGTKFRSFADPKLLGALKDINGGAIPGHVNKAEVIVKAITNLATTLGPSFSQKIDSYLSAGDEAGAIRYAQQQATDQRILDAVTKAFTYLYGKPAGKKVTTAAAGGGKGKEGEGAGAGAGAGKPGDFRAINYNPSASSIDIKKTTELAKTLGTTYTKLITQNKAVLKNGHKVTWKHDAPDEGR